MQGGFAGGESVQFRFQFLGGGKFGEPSLLDLSGYRLKQDDLNLNSTQEFFLVLRRLVAVIDRFQLTVGVDLLSQEGKVGDPLFRIPQAFPGTDGGGGNGFFRVIGAQGFEPGEPFLIRRPCGDILSPLDFISFPLQQGKQIFQAGENGDQPVDGSFQLCLVTGAVLRGMMLDVALALVSAGDDDGQIVFSAQPVAGPAYLVVAAFVGMVVLVISEADRIENQVIMNVILVNVSGEDKFIFAA